MSVAAHLPALQVVVPLIAAPLMRAVAPIGELAFAVVAGASAGSRSRSRSRSGCRSARPARSPTRIGSWPPPWGIEYRVDAPDAFVLVLVAGIAAVVLPYSGASIDGRAAARAALPVLHDVRAVPGGTARHHDHRRRVQHLRVPRDLVALDLRADRARARPPGAVRRVPVPDHGHDRRHLHRHRRRPALPDDRHAQPGRHGARLRAICGAPRPVLAALAFLTVGILAQARAVPAASVAAQRLRLRAVGGVRVPRGHRDQGGGLRAAALLLLRVRRERPCSSRCRWPS